MLCNTLCNMLCDVLCEVADSVRIVQIVSRGADEERGAGGDDEDQRELQVRSNGEDGGHVGWRGPR